MYFSFFPCSMIALFLFLFSHVCNNTFSVLQVERQQSQLRHISSLFNRTYLSSGRIIGSEGMLWDFGTDGGEFLYFCGLHWYHIIRLIIWNFFSRAFMLNFSCDIYYPLKSWAVVFSKLNNGHALNFMKYSYDRTVW